ncbi:cytochrome c3 family protein [Desulfurivibrio sp. D14AmB]|uniref:cytochrome c3 family protein n=1 Tax=Desulfurivibrio sp. D14AmB TaxID=3374370 RepID=UPI00376EE99E
MKAATLGGALLLPLILGASAWPLLASSSIVDTKHNLSATGPGPIKSEADEICIFCHTPHHASPEFPYLWNRQLSTEEYIPYQSSTLYAAVGQPTGSSKLCLSCHDGTIALGALLTRPEITFEGEVRFMPEGFRSRLGTDLGNDHPISFVYDAELARRNPRLRDPDTLPPAIHLDRNQELQCTACHNPHDNSFGKFLVISNEYSDLCVACHAPGGWEESSHALSTATWNETGPDPWPTATYDTVARNGCENCHTSHDAGGPERLLNHAAEEDNCLVCHNGNVATTDIGAELLKEFRHGVQDYFAIHDPTEDFSSGLVEKHVECADCHNPHQVNAGRPETPIGQPRPVSGATAGVSGIAFDGQPLVAAEYEYEICLKCHGDAGFFGRDPLARQIDNRQNLRRAFAPDNPSFHPVVEFRSRAGRPAPPSLLPPYDLENRLIGCGDCHNNSNPAGPRGAHGSDYPYLLAKNYETEDPFPDTPIYGSDLGAYALCYQCHDRSSLLSDQSFKEHYRHIVTQQTPCAVCHDPHGVSLRDGATEVNNSHLLNFATGQYLWDDSLVQPDSQGRLYFESLGPFSGQCFLNCHGVAHEPKSY